MDEWTASQIVTLCGFGLGLAMGATARGARFCTFGAIEDWVLADRTERIRSFALAIAVAVIAVQAMRQAGIARIDESIYLAPRFGWFGAAIGGLLFGFGMALAGTCGYGILVRIGGGDLKAMADVLILGLTAYMTARGLTGLLRIAVIEPFAIDMTGLQALGLPDVVGAAFGMAPTHLFMALGLIAGGILIAWCFANRDFRRSRRDIVAGLIIGVAVAAGFLATGTLGDDPFEPVGVASLTYALPPGETLIWLATFSGATADFGIGAVIGTICGSFVVAVAKKELRWEAFDDDREMRRHLLGAFLMGFGGVTALGCTIGQGISGMSTLSLTAPIAFASIVIGAVFGLHYILTGSIREAAERFIPGR